MSSSGSSDAVVPVEATMFILVALGTTIFGYLLKDCLVAFNPEKEQAIDEKRTTYGIFVSPVHAFAALYYVFFVTFGITMIFATDWLASPNCLAVKLMASIGWLGAKSSQYGFFIMRLSFVFRECDFVVDPGMTKKLNVVLIFFLVNAIGASIAQLAQNGTSSVGTKYGSNLVCDYATQEFSAGLVWSGLNFMLCDTVIMVSVLYQFLWRLLDLAKQSVNDEVRSLAFHSAGLGMVSLLSTYVTAFVLNGHGYRLAALVAYLAPFIDMWVGMAVITALLHDSFKGKWLLAQQWRLEMLAADKQGDKGAAEE